ncbi:uncharacterized protein LOC5515625 [Nematostella vectensis]|uniref:uncharacterized protein LOC5515625 n=1 Tax=Nematostella vectensis TaxID=45351 RepID=UPI0020775860|nr:uncharacterized protein LOC5515625 [Nematostella vectensis]
MADCPMNHWGRRWLPCCALCILVALGMLGNVICTQNCHEEKLKYRGLPYGDATFYWPLESSSALKEVINCRNVSSVYGAVTSVSSPEVSYGVRTSEGIRLGTLQESCIKEPSACINGLSIALWINIPQSASTTDGIVLCTGDDSGNISHVVMTSKGLKIEVQLLVSDKRHMASFDVAAGDWIQVVITHNAIDGLVYYKNGKRYTESVNVTSISSVQVPSTNLFLSYAAKEAGKQASYREIAVWDRTITEPEVMALYRHTPGCQEIAPSDMTFSSRLKVAPYDARNAHFDSKLGWCAGGEVSSSLLEVTLSEVFKVYSIVLHQVDFDGSIEFVKSLNVQWSLDGIKWTRAVTVSGLTSSSEFRVLDLPSGPAAMKIMQITPLDSEGRKCMRLKLLGYKLGPLNIIASINTSTSQGPSHCSVMVNGMEYCPNKPGHNLVALNVSSGEFLATANFNTQSDESAGNNMSHFIDGLENGTMVVVVVKDSGHRNTPRGLMSLYELGAQSALPLGENTQFILIGRKGKLDYWIAEKSASANEGNLSLNASIQLRLEPIETHYWPMDVYDFTTVHGSSISPYYRSNIKDYRGGSAYLQRISSFPHRFGALYSDKGRLYSVDLSTSDCLVSPSNCPGGVSVSWWIKHHHEWLVKGEVKEPASINDNPSLVLVDQGTIRVSEYSYLSENNRHKVTLLSFGTGHMIDAQSFDMVDDATASGRFKQMLESAPYGTVVLISADGNTKLDDAGLISVLGRVGAVMPALTMRDSYCFIGYKGVDGNEWKEMDWVEEVNNANSGCRLYKRVPFYQPWRSPVGIQNRTLQHWQLRTNNLDPTNPPGNARLHHNINGWSGISSGGFLEIELPVTAFLGGLATQGSGQSDSWVKSYSLQYAVDIKNWEWLREDGLRTEYVGNSDRHTVMKHYFRRPLNTRLVRIVVVTFHVAPILRAELFYLNTVYRWIENQALPEPPDPPDSPLALGLESGATPDSKLQASSARQAGQAAKFARLHLQASKDNDACWCPDSADTEKSLDIMLSERSLVTGVAIQGRGNGQEWVTELTIAINDTIEGQEYIIQENKTTKVFNGNFDSNSVVKLTFASAMYATSIKLKPRSWHGHPCLRAEVYGYPQLSSCFAPLLPRLHDNHLSMSEGSSAASARLSSAKAWCADTSSLLFLQMDLGEPTVVSGIATKGMSETWCTGYYLSYSRDGLEWTEYKASGIRKVFVGNTDESSLVVQPLNPSLETRFVRLHPLTSSSPLTVCVKVELFGCFTENPRFDIVGPVEINAAISSFLTLTASYRICPHGLACPNCTRQVYVEVFGETKCAVSQPIVDCHYHQFTLALIVPTHPDIYNIRVFAAVGEVCKGVTPRGVAGKLIGRVLAKVHTARSCADLLLMGHRKSGVYTIRPSDSLFTVFCDQDTHGGGWTVLQRRFNGSVDFYKTWDEYKEGFGSFEGEFWAGNDNIHRLTSVTPVELLIELEDFEGQYKYAKYQTFSVGDEGSKYLLTVGGYSGTTGDSLTRHSGSFFSTKDRDEDGLDDFVCSELFRSGFWYFGCKDADLNGQYQGKTGQYGIRWEAWGGSSGNFKASQMKIRPLDAPMTCVGLVCFYIRNVAANWWNAVKGCLDLGAEIASVNTEDTNNILTAILKAKGIGTAYIGLNDIENEGTVAWKGGQIVDNGYQNIAGNNHRDNDCVYMSSSDGKWRFKNCVHTTAGYICKRGLMCHQASCYVPANGSFSVTNGIYMCNNTGMTPLKILSADQNTFVTSRVAQGSRILIGLNDNRAEGEWEWHDGTRAKYVKWITEEPNGGTANNNAVLSAAGWNDVESTETVALACQEEIAKSCRELLELGVTTSGIYKIRPDDGEPITVYCDQEGSGGGWEVILKRFDGSVSFHDKSWKDFKSLIGSLDGEFYIGHNDVGRITESGRELLVTFGYGTTIFTMRYYAFKVHDESRNYYMYVGNLASGNTSSYLSHLSYHSFSTLDVDKDGVVNKNCASLASSAGWYGISASKDCDMLWVNPFGLWSTTEASSSYLYWHGINQPINYFEMKTRYADSGLTQLILGTEDPFYANPRQGLYVNQSPHQFSFHVITSSEMWYLVTSPRQGWVRYTYTWSDVNGARVYENDRLLANTRGTREAKANNPRGYIYIGMEMHYARKKYTFLLSQLKTWSKELSLEEVQEEYHTIRNSFEDHGLDDVRLDMKTHQWNLTSGCTPSIETGPCKDNTYKHQRGSYVYFEASYPNSPRQIATLFRTIVQPDYKCVSLSYHMYGSQVGSLNVAVVHISRDYSLYDAEEHREEVWMRAGNQGDKWHLLEVNITSQAEYRLEITATTGEGYRGDIAIDDLKLTVDSCTESSASLCSGCKEGYNCNTTLNKCECQDLQFVNDTCHDVLLTTVHAGADHYWPLDDAANIKDTAGGVSGDLLSPGYRVLGAINHALHVEAGGRIVFGDLSGSCIVSKIPCPNGLTILFWIKPPKNDAKEERIYLEFGHFTSDILGFIVKQDYALIADTPHLVLDATMGNDHCQLAFPIIPEVWSHIVLLWKPMHGWNVIHNGRNITEFILDKCAALTSSVPTNKRLQTGMGSVKPAVTLDDLVVRYQAMTLTQVTKTYKHFVAPQNMITLSVKFPDEKFKPQMLDEESEEYKEFKNKLMENVRAILMANGNFQNIELHMLSNGSVNANFSMRFVHLSFEDVNVLWKAFCRVSGLNRMRATLIDSFVHIDGVPFLLCSSAYSWNPLDKCASASCGEGRHFVYDNITSAFGREWICLREFTTTLHPPLEESGYA